MADCQIPHENPLLFRAVWLWMLAVAILEFSYVTADPDLWGHIYRVFLGKINITI